jgi:DNA-nicking Smr family endonuclease
MKQKYGLRDLKSLNIPTSKNTACAPSLKVKVPTALDQTPLMQWSDEFDASHLLEGSPPFYRQAHMGKDLMARLLQLKWPIDGQLDLHHLHVHEARQQLVLFLQQAHQQQWRCVCIIHGLGNGSPQQQPVLKTKVWSWLTQTPMVSAFVQAPGGGATLALLKKNNRHFSRK